MWVLTSTSAFLKAIFIDNTDRMSIRRTAIKIYIFEIKVVRVKLILFKL